MPEDGSNTDSGKHVEMMKRKKFIMQFVRIAIILAVIAAFTYHMNLQCRKYLNPQTTPVEKVMQSSQFPDVTMCYPTYFNELRLKKNKYQNELDYLTVVFKRNLKFLWEMAKLNSANVSGLDYIQGFEYIPQAELTLLPLMTQNSVGATVHDSLMLCSYNRMYCDFQNFTTFRDGTYGLCFQFSSSESISAPPGIENGLMTIIETYGVSRVKFDNIYGGLNIFVHSKGTWPTSEKLSGMGQAKLQTAISFNYQSIRKLNKADSPCKNTGQLALCRMEVPKGLVCRSYKETNSMLKQVSLQEQLENRCSCVTYEWPIPEKLRNRISCHFIPEKAFLHRGVEVSSTFAVSIRPMNASAAPVPLAEVVDMQKVRQRYQCYMDFKNGLANGSISLKTETLCYSENYITSVFQGKGKICDSDNNKKVCASAEHQALVKSIWFDKMIPNLQKRNLTSVTLNAIPANDFVPDYRRYLARDGVQVNVFQNFIAGVDKEETYLYNYLYFIADIGGVTGLWIGMSFITIFEITEWLVRKLVRAREVKLSSSSIRPNK